MMPTCTRLLAVGTESNSPVSPDTLAEDITRKWQHFHVKMDACYRFLSCSIMPVFVVKYEKFQVNMARKYLEVFLF
jgi:hypothetical protein